MRKTAKAMALLTAASMIMTAFTPVYAESTDTEDTAAVDWENGENIKAIKEKGRSLSQPELMYHLNTEMMTTIL